MADINILSNEEIRRRAGLDVPVVPDENGIVKTPKPIKIDLTSATPPSPTAPLVDALPVEEPSAAPQEQGIAPPEDILLPKPAEIASTIPTLEEMTAKLGLTDYIASGGASINYFPIATKTPVDPDLDAMLKTELSTLNDNDTNLAPADFIGNEKYFGIIKTFMTDRFGKQYDKIDRESTVEDFLVHSRKFSAGQSLVTAQELSYLYGAMNNEDTSKLTSAHNAYELFDRLGGITSANYTWGDTFDGLGTYVRAAIIDPMTPLSFFGVGLIGRGTALASAKAAAYGATKVAAGLAKVAGPTLAIRAMAKKVAEVAVTRAVKEGATETAQRQIYSATFEKAIAKSMQLPATAAAIKKEVLGTMGATMVLDASINSGMEVMRQSGLIVSGNMQDYDYSDIGIAAGAAIAVPAIVGVRTAFRKGTEGVTLTASDVMSAKEKDIEVFRADLTKAQLAAPSIDGKNIGVTLKRGVEAMLDPNVAGEWKVKVAAENNDIGIASEFSFWKEFLKGDDGFFVALRDAGVRDVGSRFRGDNFTNNLADLLKQLPKEDADAVRDVIIKTGGSVFKEYQNYSMEELANRMAKVISFSGKNLQIMSAGSKMLNAAELAAEEATAAGTSIGKTLLQRIRYGQDYLIRNIVTHPATSVLNIKGWAMYEGVFAPVKDMILAGIYGGKYVLTLGTQKEAGAKAAGIFKNILNRTTYLGDPEQSIDTARAYLSKSQNAREQLAQTLYGGIETSQSSARLKQLYGFDPNANTWTQPFEKVQSFMQDLYFVKAQDMFTKSSSFLAALDKESRIKYGRGLKEMMKADDAINTMQTKEWLELEARAVSTTQEATFSKSYHRSVTKSSSFISLVATAAEEARSIPFLGMQVPFGRFFNNTIAFMSDATGISAMRKMAFNLGGDDRPLEELLARAAAGYTIIGYGLDAELSNIDLGLAWNQGQDTDGSIQDYKYEYPYSLFKMGSRILAHIQKGEKVPPDLMKLAKNEVILGQITRNVDESMRDVNKIFDLMIQDQDFAQAFINTKNLIIDGPAVSIATSLTRPLDPINQALAIARGGDYAQPDRKQGYETLNNGLRYVDQFADALSEALTNKKMFTPASSISREGTMPATPSRILAEREVLPLTDIDIMFNSVALQEWQQGLTVKEDRAAEARFKPIFQVYLDREAKLINSSEKFKTWSMPDRRAAVVKAVSRARKNAKETLVLSTDPTDAKYALIINLAGGQAPAKYKREKMNQALEYVGANGRKLSELTVKELQAVTWWLDNRDAIAGLE